MDTAALERAGAIARLVCTLVAGIATMLGFYLDADELFTGICCIVALVCLIVTWWKNNNLTDAAIEAQEVLDSLKSGDLEDLAGVECTDGDSDDGEAGGSPGESGEDDPEGEVEAIEPEDATVSEAVEDVAAESIVFETIDGETVETVSETYPDASWTKKEIAAWLEARGVEVRSSWNKSELLARVEEALQQS